LKLQQEVTEKRIEMNAKIAFEVFEKHKERDV